MSPSVGKVVSPPSQPQQKRPDMNDRKEDWQWEQTGEAAWEKLCEHGVMATCDEPDSDIDSDGERKPQPRACAVRKLRWFRTLLAGHWAPWQRRCAADTPALAFPEQLGKTLLLEEPAGSPRSLLQELSLSALLARS